MGKPAINYEFDTKPDIGETFEIAAGVHWLRMPLPFSLQHINLWLLADDDGWIIVDTGLGFDDSKAIWERTFEGFMRGAPIKHVLVTHMHPDHVGCAGWLADRFNVDLWMTREEYAMCRVLVSDTGRAAPEAGTDFYTAAGYAPEALEHYRKIFGFFGKYVTPLPDSYRRLYDGQKEPVGDYEWEVVVGRGHSPEHACFLNEELNLLISGDQILPAISSNVSVYPLEPEANPLNDWIDSLRAIRERVPEDVLVLPAHGKPFRGVRGRIDSMVNEHLARLSDLAEYCKEPRRAVDVFPALYRAKITNDNLMFATGEAIAHLNYLIADGEIVAESDSDNVNWYRQT
jgi:glyoxylase-like metal-dependent hydrolase (beta-lactamase superfamily II)